MIVNIFARDGVFSKRLDKRSVKGDGIRRAKVYDHLSVLGKSRGEIDHNGLRASVIQGFYDGEDLHDVFQAFSVFEEKQTFPWDLSNSKRERGNTSPAKARFAKDLSL